MRNHHARHGRAGTHRRRHRRQAILPAILAAVLAGLTLTGIFAATAATHLAAMHYWG
jgi:cell division protein FtsB